MKGGLFDLIQREKQLVCTESKENRFFDENTSVLSELMSIITSWGGSPPFTVSLPSALPACLPVCVCVTGASKNSQLL